jgi:hypothetical protein
VFYRLSPARQLYRIESLLPPRRGVTAAVLMEMIKETHCTLLFQLLMFPSHRPFVNNAICFDITEQTLNMDSITACLSATESNPSIGTVSTAYLPVQRAQTSNNLSRIRAVLHSAKDATQSDVWKQIKSSFLRWGLFNVWALNLFIETQMAFRHFTGAVSSIYGHKTYKL